MPNTFWIMAGIPCAILVGLAAYEFVLRHYRMKGYEPIVDQYALEAELDEAFGRPAVQQGARLQ